MPKKLTAEEAKAMGLRPSGTKHPVRTLLDEMEVGEIIYITISDFRWKHATPQQFINKIEKNSSKKFSMKNHPGKLGWVVERLK